MLQPAVLSDDERNRSFRYMCSYPQPWPLWLKPGQMTPFVCGQHQLLKEGSKELKRNPAATSSSTSSCQSPACSGVPPAHAMERQATSWVALFEMKKPCAGRPRKIPRPNKATSSLRGLRSLKGPLMGPPSGRKERWRSAPVQAGSKPTSSSSPS